VFLIFLSCCGLALRQERFESSSTKVKGKKYSAYISSPVF
jgi:hypothetical protein